MDVYALKAMLKMLLEQYETAADWRKEQLNISIPQLRNIIGEIDESANTSTN